MDYFSAFWSIQLRKVGKELAIKAASKIKDEQWPEIMLGYQKYIKFCKQQGVEKKYQLHPSSYLNQKRWLDELELEEEVQAESATYNFMKLVQNKNNLTMPLMPHDIKQAVFRMGIPWGKLQQMDRMELEAKFESAYNYKPDEIVDRQKLAAGDNT